MWDLVSDKAKVDYYLAVAARHERLALIWEGMGRSDSAKHSRDTAELYFNLAVNHESGNGMG